MDNIFAARLEELDRQGLYRSLTTYTPVSATHVRLGDMECLMLASSNYLGLTHHPSVRQAAADAAQLYGSGSGGSRLTTGTHPLYSSLERDLASFKGTEAALVFNTGYMANVGVLNALAGAQDVIFSDELNHASIIDGCRLSLARVIVYRHSDMADLSAKLAATPCQGLRLIVTDGVFSMDGDIALLDRIVVLAEEHNALVMVDDAHATGVIGNGGHGTAAYFGLAERIHVQMGTLSKALAAEGGYIAGSQVLIDYLINKARSFIFSTALAPATIAAAQAALALIVAQPVLVRTVQENARYLRGILADAGLNVGESETPIIPVLVGNTEKATTLATTLRRNGLIVSAIRPPTVPPGTSRLRITVSAAHSREDLVFAVDRIISAAKAAGI